MTDLNIYVLAVNQDNGVTLTQKHWSGELQLTKDLLIAYVIP